MPQIAMNRLLTIRELLRRLQAATTQGDRQYFVEVLMSSVALFGLRSIWASFPCPSGHGYRRVGPSGLTATANGCRARRVRQGRSSRKLQFGWSRDVARWFRLGIRKLTATSALPVRSQGAQAKGVNHLTLPSARGSAGDRETLHHKWLRTESRLVRGIGLRTMSAERRIVRIGDIG